MRAPATSRRHADGVVARSVTTVAEAVRFTYRRRRVTSGVEGILIPPADTDALVSELNCVLTDPDLAERLGAAAHERYADWRATAEDFARQMRDLVDLTLARSDS